MILSPTWRLVCETLLVPCHTDCKGTSVFPAVSTMLQTYTESLEKFTGEREDAIVFGWCADIRLYSGLDLKGWSLHLSIQCSWMVSTTDFVYLSTQFTFSKLSHGPLSTSEAKSSFSAVAQSSSVSLGWSGVDHNGCIFQGVLSLPCTNMFSNQVKARALFFHQNHIGWEETQAQILQMTQFILNEACVCNFNCCKKHVELQRRWWVQKMHNASRTWIQLNSSF